MWLKCWIRKVTWWSFTFLLALFWVSTNTSRGKTRKISDSSAAKRSIISLLIHYYYKNIDVCSFKVKQFTKRISRFPKKMLITQPSALTLNNTVTEEVTYLSSSCLLPGWMSPGDFHVSRLAYQTHVKHSVSVKNSLVTPAVILKYLLQLMKSLLLL